MSSTATGHPSSVRCTTCGTSNALASSACSTCKSPLDWFSQGSSDSPPMSPPSRSGGSLPAAGADDPWSWPAPPTGSSAALSDPHRKVARPSPPSSPPKPAGDLVGRVILVEPTYHEKPDFDWYWLFTKLLLLLLLLASPFLLLFGLLTFGGVLPAVLALAGMVFLGRLLKPANLPPLLHLHAILSPSRRQEIETVPVRMLRVRDEDEVEWMVRIKGHLRQGSVAADDQVSLWGRWGGGTLAVNRGYNHRTRSQIEVEQSASWFALVLTLAFILFLVAVFWEPTLALRRRFGGGL